MVIAAAHRMGALWGKWCAVTRAALAALILAIEGSTFAAFCAVHPINPMCCPTPCPVIDSAKITDFVNEAEQAWQNVEQCRQIAERYLSLVTAFGPNGPLATELRRVPGSTSNAFTTFQASVPGMLKTEDLGNPRAIAEILKAALFEPNGLGVSTLTDSVGRVGLRAAIIADEAVNALATGLHGYRRLTDVASDGGRQTVAASQATNVRSDLAVNVSTRQAVVDNLGGLQELLTSWAAVEATVSSAGHATTIEALPAFSRAAEASALAASLQAETERLTRLRQARMAVNQLDETTSALTSLHNERHAVAVMLAQYPGLWNTVASDNQAIQFRAVDAEQAISLLARVFQDGKAAFQVVQTQLLSLDPTGWKDNETKTQAASTAAQAVVQSIFAHPQIFGVLQGDLSDERGDNMSIAAFAETLTARFSPWLEDDKLERFWAPLRQDAIAAIARLDQRLTDIRDRRGFDISGSVAVEQENALLAQFSQQMQQVMATGQLVVDDGQKAVLAAYIAAFQATVTAIRSDPAASNFVTVRWPS